MSLELFVRLNLARESNWIEDFKNQSFTIIVPAHILESYQKAFARTIARSGKPFLIDPVTYIFSVERMPFNEKRWFPKLTDQYNLDVLMPTEDKTIYPHTFLDAGNGTKELYSFVDSIMNYQRNRVKDLYSEIAEMEEFDSEEPLNISIDDLRPRFLIAPYFFNDIGAADSIDLNIEAVKMAGQLKEEGEKIFAVIAIDKTWLSFPSDIRELISRYDIEGIAGFFVWISDFREYSESIENLTNYVNFVANIAKLGKPVYSLYGGLFSLLLKEKGLQGVVHSICYGEHKDVSVESGMLAVIRYYDKDLRVKAPYGKLQDLLKITKREMCKCKYCQKLDKTNDAEGGKRIEYSGKHFLARRLEEVEMLNAKKDNLILANLEVMHGTIHGKDPTGAYGHFYHHIPRWMSVLRDGKQGS